MKKSEINILVKLIKLYVEKAVKVEMDLLRMNNEIFLGESNEFEESNVGDVDIKSLLSATTGFSENDSNFDFGDEDIKIDNLRNITSPNAIISEMKQNTKSIPKSVEDIINNTNHGDVLKRLYDSSETRKQRD